MDFSALVAFGAVGVKKAVDFVSLLLDKQWQAATKQVAAWVAGIGIAVVLAHSSFGPQLGVAGLSISTLIVAGVLTASAASVGSDILSAADNTQSANYPAFSLKAFRRPKKTGSSITAANTSFDLVERPGAMTGTTDHTLATFEPLPEATPESNTELKVSKPRKPRPPRATTASKTKARAARTTRAKTPVRKTSKR